jgi:hypothetical protein
MVVYVTGFLVSMGLIFLYNKTTNPEDSIPIDISLGLSLISWFMVCFMLVFVLFSSGAFISEKVRTKRWFYKINEFWEGG